MSMPQREMKPDEDWNRGLASGHEALQGVMDEAAAARFAFRAPEAYLARLDPADPNDPLLRQVLPVAQENQEVPGFGVDPTREWSKRETSRLIRKYPNRVLLLVTDECPIHCRYCFRRHFPYPGHARDIGDLAPALAAIAADATIAEVILSGGDPLMASDGLLSRLLAALAAMAHVRLVRIHTRVPVVWPQRLRPRLLAVLEALVLPKVMVIHANHAQELDGPAAEALFALRASGFVLLNQSVLLKGVNDHIDALGALSWRLGELGVVPYYLHQLDAVAGAAHFHVEQAQAVALHRAMRAGLPGHLVPRLVQDQGLATGKTWLPEDRDARTDWSGEVG